MLAFLRQQPAIGSPDASGIAPKHTSLALYLALLRNPTHTSGMHMITASSGQQGPETSRRLPGSQHPNDNRAVSTGNWHADAKSEMCPDSQLGTTLYRPSLPQSR